MIQYARAVFVTAWAVVVVVTLVSCGKEPATPAPGEKAAVALTNSTVSATPAAFKKLVGQWERPDGGYVLDLRSVDASGQMQAVYLNPSPIHVSKALALREGEEVKVFVELRDVNYPGCTYSLKYDPQHDQLYGEYFQAGMGQRFDVTFARLKTGAPQ